MNPMRKYLLCSAAEHNWGLTGPGDWSRVNWTIYSDRSYRIRVKFNPTEEEYKRCYYADTYEKPKGKVKTRSGTLDEKTFLKLVKLLSTKEWRNPNIQIHVCDGEAWVIRHYSEDRELINSSGELGYIYGERVLQDIVSCLPHPDGIYSSEAFISVTRNE